MRDLPLLIIRFISVMGLIGACIESSAAELTVAAILCFLTLLLRLSHTRSNFDALFVGSYGFFIPLLPWIGPQILLTSGLFFVIIRGFDQNRWRYELLWAAPFIGYLSGTVLGEFGIALNFQHNSYPSVLSNISFDGPDRVVDFFRTIFDVHISSWRLAARAVLFTILLALFTSSAVCRRLFFKWLLIAAIPSALFVILQWLMTDLRLPNQTPMWDSLNRLSGLMSDPNALGVMMALILWSWLLASPRAPYHSGWVILIVAAGFISGSRTFLISCVCLCAALVWMHLQKRVLWIMLGGILLISSVTAIDYLTPIVINLSNYKILPEGIRRGISALSLIRINETFYSRSIFIEFARAIIENRWLTGIGADRFIEYVPLIGAQHGLVRGWTDNSNNFYLGLLTELGLLGVICFSFSAIGRRLPNVGSKLSAVSLLLMLVLILCTGPHSDFIEVLVVMAALIGSVTVPRDVPKNLAIIAGIIGIILGVFSSGFHEYGAYGWSDSRTGAIRWLDHHARIRLPCEAVYPEQVNTPINARTMLFPVYLPQKQPLTVNVYRNGRIQQQLLFSERKFKEIIVECNPGEDAVFITVETKPPWSPYRAWPGHSDDRRILGVQQAIRAD